MTRYAFAALAAFAEPPAPAEMAGLIPVTSNIAGQSCGCTQSHAGVDRTKAGAGAIDVRPSVSAPALIRAKQDGYVFPWIGMVSIDHRQDGPRGALPRLDATRCNTASRTEASTASMSYGADDAWRLGRPGLRNAVLTALGLHDGLIREPGGMIACTTGGRAPSAPVSRPCPP